MGGTRFMVQWEEHPSHLATRLGQLLEHQTLVDVTLMCNTHTLRVHRAVLAACSPYFETILQRQLGMHPLIVLKDMQFSVLKSLIEFMYCGETSVTEDNLGALLQAAKFFQVKGLSAMTKEALGLVPSAKSAVNGDAARKAFVGRPKRVGMQQTFVTSGLKTVSGTHASGSHGTASGSDLPTLPTKTTFQTISKPVAARPDTQQQTDTAQLLLSLSGSEFPKQTFHTVSKNVRFQHNVSGNAVSVESGRSTALDGNVKTKEVVGRIPVMTSNGGVKASSSVSQPSGQIVEHSTSAAGREDVLVANPQSVYLAEGFRRRGRPVKRQMNVLFQEKVMTDADFALHKEAEASRKALEMLRQEMSTDTLETNVSTSPAVAGTVATSGIASASLPLPTSTSNVTHISNVHEHMQKGLVKQNTVGGPKLQVQSVQAPFVATSRTIAASQTVSNPVSTKRMNANVVYKTVNAATTNVNSKKVTQTAPGIVSPTDTANSVNVTFKMDETEIPQVFHLSEEPTQEPPKEEAVEFQVSEPTENETELAGANQNIVYQVADTNNAPAGSVMSQYMEVLKEAGLPTDVPILLDSGDGSYVTVNEEVLMNIVNGGVLQCHVTEGNIVAGDGVEFIVQEITEDEMEAVQAQVQEQTLNQTAETEKVLENKLETQSTLVTQTEALEPATNTMEIAPNTLENTNAVEVSENPMEASSVLETANTFETPTCTLEDVNPSDNSGPMREVHMTTDSVELPREEGNKTAMHVDGEKEQSLPSEALEMKNAMSLGSIGEKVENSNAEMENGTTIVTDFPDVSKGEVLSNQVVNVDTTGIKLDSFSTTEDETTIFTNEQGNPDSGICGANFSSSEINQEEPKTEKSNHDDMSVEQALQAMMGEGSDTEMESCTHSNVHGTIPTENVSELEASRPLDDEKSSEDLHFVLRSEDGSDDLRLVLGPVEDMVKEGRCEDSNSLALVLNPGNTNCTDAEKSDLGKEESVTDLETTTNTNTTEDLNINMIQDGSSDITPTQDNEYERICVNNEPDHVSDNLQVKSVQQVFLDPESITDAEASQLPSKVSLHEGGENNEFAEHVPGENISSENEEILHLTSSTTATPAEAACDATEHPNKKGAVISPSKDIPFAVGLLPLRTALEKLQAMSEYHPRKTRSSSTGKESTADIPAARVKRKASTSDGPDKRLKMSSTEGDSIGQQVAGEESGGDATMDMVASTTIPEGEKDETLLSMPD